MDKNIMNEKDFDILTEELYERLIKTPLYDIETRKAIIKETLIKVALTQSKGDKKVIMDKKIHLFRNHSITLEEARVNSKGSIARRYCEENGIPFVNIEMKDK